MRLLLVCTTCPVPPAGGAALRELGWLHTAAGFAEVGLATLTRSPREEEALADLERVCRVVRGVPAPRRAGRKLVDLVLAGATGVPYLVRSGRERRLEGVVDRLIRDWLPDVVQAELLPSAPYLGGARERGIPTVYGAHNVESRIVTGPAGRRGARVRARRMRRFEERVAREVDAVVAVSRVEATWFGDRARRVVHLPNAVDPDRSSFTPPSERRGASLLFVGHLGYPPNADAATILARQVYPEVRRALPDARCVIAGAAPGRAVGALAGDGVEVVPDPADMEPLWAAAGVLVCPLRWGGGSRLKILQAAARGLPVASTPVGAEGLELEPGVHYAAAADAAGLAAAAGALLRDVALADAMAGAARRAVEQHHSWSRLQPLMRELYEGLLGDHRPR